MALFASLTITSLALLPQAQESKQAPKPEPKQEAKQEQGAANSALRTDLTKAEHQSLNRKAKAWFEAWIDETRATKARDKEGAQRKEQHARDAFLKEWDSKRRKGREERDLLANVGDLQQIFADVFPYPRQSSSGEPKRFPAVSSGRDEMPGYTVMVPRGYNADRAYRGVLLVPGFDDKLQNWTDGVDHYAATWKASQLAAETICMVPDLDKGLEMDPVPDLTKELDRQAEDRRNWYLLRGFGQVNRDYRLDRDRLILDAGKDACGHALRLTTSFPNQFAGIVLRWPVDIDDVRLDNLAGVPVLLLYDDKTKAAAERIHETLEKLEPGFCRMERGKGDYPFPGSVADVDAWAKDVQRNLFRSKVVVAPNQNRFLKAYWVNVTQMEPVETLPRKDRPRLTVEADRAANRITVDAKHIGGLTLLLNDALVDLDKEITVVVNGKATTMRQGRQFSKMIDLLFMKFDPGFLFTTEVILDVPPEPAAANATSGNGAANDAGKVDADGKAEPGGDAEPKK